MTGQLVLLWWDWVIDRHCKVRRGEIVRNHLIHWGLSCVLFKNKPWLLLRRYTRDIYCENGLLTNNSFYKVTTQSTSSSPGPSSHETSSGWAKMSHQKDEAIQPQRSTLPWPLHASGKCPRGHRGSAPDHWKQESQDQPVLWVSVWQWISLRCDS